MKRIKNTHGAFTLIEVVFVIVVLGIVASLGSEIIAKVYQGYIVERSEYRANIKTELAINEIANRLRYAIKGTVVARQSTTATPVAISSVGSSDNKVLQWVAYDGDSFEAIEDDSNRKPGWSGFCDLKASSQDTVVTPGSNLNLAQTIVSKLGGDISNSVIYFKTGPNYDVRQVDGNQITLDDNATEITERYQLAWTSYALSVENGDLYLYYDFTPKTGASLADANKSLLLKHVTNFRFKGTEGSIRIKICKEEKIGDGNVTSCKEKVVF